MKRLLLPILLILLLAACAPVQPSITPPVVTATRTATETISPKQAYLPTFQAKATQWAAEETLARAATAAQWTKTPTKIPYHTPTPLPPIFDILPPGEYVIQIYYDYLGNTKTFAVSITDNAIHPLTQDQFVTTSTNGRYLILEQQNNELTIYDYVTKTEKSITAKFTYFTPRSYSLSPDGLHLAGTSNNRIIIKNLDNQQETEIISMSYEYDSILSSAWSPNGNWIAYLQRSGECGFRGKQFCTNDGIYIISTQCLQEDSAICYSKPYGPFLNTGKPSFGAISWSPDSQKLAYAEMNDNRIMIYDIELGTESVLSLQNEICESFSWVTVDWIAYINFDGIFLISPETQDTVQISDSPGWISGWLVVSEPTPTP